jgi:hypothetical protein
MNNDMHGMNKSSTMIHAEDEQVEDVESAD